MPPVKDEKTPIRPVNTSAQIQQIFSEIQSQLPSVNFDNDDDHNDEDDNDNEETWDSNMPENTDALLESLSSSNNNSFLTIHPRIETPQQPPSVESQMRVSPNLFDNYFPNQASPPKPSILSMDLFNSIDFDKLPSLAPPPPPQASSLTHTFNRPRPANHRQTSSQQPTQKQQEQQQQQTNIKSRDDRQILERLAQQANKFNTSDKSPVTRDNHPFRNLESALCGTTHEHVDRHGKRVGVPESERKTIYIDLRNSNVQKQEKTFQDSRAANTIKPIRHQIQSSESESDDEQNDGMLWFERRQQAKQQQQSNASKE